MNLLNFITSRGKRFGSMPGFSTLGLCTEDDYGLPVDGCLTDGVNTSGLLDVAPYWESKFDLNTRWDFMPALIASGLLDNCPIISTPAALGRSVYTGVRYYRSTWVPSTSAWTFAALVKNPRFDINPSFFLGTGVADLRFQQYLGATLSTGQSATNPSGSNPLPLDKPVFIQFQMDRSSAVGSNLWINGQAFVGASAWDLTGLSAPTLLTLGGSSQFYFKATYGFNGKVDSTNLFNWIKKRYPTLSF